MMRNLFYAFWTAAQCVGRDTVIFALSCLLLAPGQMGTGGTGIAATPNSSMLTVGQSKHFTGIEDAASASVTASAPATYRTNLGLIETSGQPVTVRESVRYYFPAGLVLSGHTASSKDFTLLPGQFVMVTDAMKAIIGEARTSFGDLQRSGRYQGHRRQR
jgi:hypothetical protein